MLKNFKPERFLGIENETSFFKEKGFMPFRVCIGQKFAMMETTILIAMILHKFNISFATPNQKLETSTSHVQL